MPLTLLLLAVAADQPAAVVVKPPELPPAVRERVRALAVNVGMSINWNVTYNEDDVCERTAKPLHLQELAELDCWLALRPHDLSRRRRALRLATVIGETGAVARHTTALCHTLLLATNQFPCSAARRLELARTLMPADQNEEVFGLVTQAVRLDPSSAAARIMMGRVLSAANDYPAAMREIDLAADLDPADWRVSAARCDIRLGHVKSLKPYDPTVPAELSACELDRQSALRLGGTDAGCLRWSALTAQQLGLVLWPRVQAFGAERRGMDVVLPALALAADHDPADARMVRIAVSMELTVLRSKAGDLQPAGPDKRTAFDRLPPDARRRVERWLRRTAEAVATDDGPEAAEKAVTAAGLFRMMRQFDRAVAAAERAVHLRPASLYCEDVLQTTLLYSKTRAAKALDRCRVNAAGRSPAARARFEMTCLYVLGRWQEIERVANATPPDDPELTLIAVAGRLSSDTPAARATAAERMAAVWAVVADHPPSDPARQEAARLQIIADLLAGRLSEAVARLDRCRREGQPVRDDDELAAAARTYLWPTTDVVPAAAVDLPTARSPTR